MFGGDLNHQEIVALCPQRSEVVMFPEKLGSRRQPRAMTRFCCKTTITGRRVKLVCSVSVTRMSLGNSDQARAVQNIEVDLLRFETSGSMRDDVSLNPDNASSHTALRVVSVGFRSMQTQSQEHLL